MLTAALARHLHALGLATYGEAGADCFLEDLPLDPVAAVGLFATGGPQPRPYVGLRRPGVQVLVRGDDDGGRARSGFDLADAILAALDDTARVVWGSGSPDALRVAWCLATQSQPTDIGVDENGRPRWSVRFEVETHGGAQ